MKSHRSLFFTLLLLVSMFVTTFVVQAQPDEPSRPPQMLFVKVAEPHAGLLSLTQGGAENFPMTGGDTADNPLARVTTGQRFRLYSAYEADFFPSAVGSATFELQVSLVRDDATLTPLGHDHATASGTGPRQKRGTLSVSLSFPNPGSYHLVITSTTTARPVGAAAPVVDTDTSNVIVVVLGSTAGATPAEVPQTRDGNITAADDVQLEAHMTPAHETPVHPMPSRTPDAEKTPMMPPKETDRELLVASPRGHFIVAGTGVVAAAENYDAVYNRTLVVRQGYTLTFKSAYEFVWFDQAAGRATTDLTLYRQSSGSANTPLGDDHADVTGGPGPAKQVGTLQVVVPFNEAGRFLVGARVRTQVFPTQTLQVATQDEDTVMLQVLVIGGEPNVGAITGTVTSDVSGAPLQGVVVTVLNAHGGRPRGVARSAADGTYTVPSLPAGQYLLWANPLEQNYLPEWYNNSSTREGATPVTVTVNSTTPDIDFALTPGGAITGTVTEENGGTPATPIANAVITVGRSGEEAAFTAGRSLADGSYRVDRLPAGSYWVYAGNPAKSLIGEYYNNRSERAAADPVQVTAGNDTPNIDFALRYGGTVMGHVVGIPRPTETRTSFKVTAYDWDSSLAVRTVDVLPGGAYAIPSLPEGRYRIYAFDEGHAYIPQYYNGVTRPEDATAVTVSRTVVTRGIDFELSAPGMALLQIRPLVTQVKPGDTFSVTAFISAAVDLGAFEFVMTYDPAIIEPLSAELGDFLGSTGRTVHAVGPVTSAVSGTLAFGGLSLGPQAGPSGYGTLATITFRAKINGGSALRLTNVLLTDTHAQPIQAHTYGATVEVGNCILGDFDCDCDVDVNDVMAVARRWGTRSGDPDYDARYDLDHDGDIDIVDVSLVAAAWGNTCDQPTTDKLATKVRSSAKAGPAPLATGLSLDPAQANAQIGQPTTLQVKIAEALDLASFEFTLTYDATKLAVSAPDVTLGDFLASSGRAATAMSPQITVQNGVGTLHYAAFTLGATPAGPNGTGVLATIKFTPLAAGQTAITFTDAKVTDTSGQSQESLAMQGATLNVTGAGMDKLAVPFVER